MKPDLKRRSMETGNGCMKHRIQPTRMMVMPGLLLAVLGCSCIAQRTPESVPQYAGVAPELDSPNVGPAYRGIDPEMVYKGLLSLGVGQSKSPFETTTEFEDRKRAVNTGNVLPNVPTSGRLAFVLNEPDTLALLGSVKINYDADLELFSVIATFNEKTFLGQDGPTTVTADLKSKFETLGHSVRQNVFGATVDVSTDRAEHYGLALDRDTWLTQRRTLPGEILPKAGVGFSFHMSHDAARQASSHLRVLLLCALREPWMLSSFASLAPTLSNPSDYTEIDRYLYVVPVELWAYDEASGGVLAKLNEESLRVEQARQEQEQAVDHQRLFPLRLEVNDATGRRVYDSSDWVYIEIDGGKGYETDAHHLPVNLEAQSKIRISVANKATMNQLRFKMNGQTVRPDWRAVKEFGERFAVIFQGR